MGSSPCVREGRPRPFDRALVGSRCAGMAGALPTVTLIYLGPHAHIDLSAHALRFPSEPSLGSGMAKQKGVPVTMRALVQRINRKLKAGYEVLKATRGD